MTGEMTVHVIEAYQEGEIPADFTARFFKADTDLTGYDIKAVLIQDGEHFTESGTAGWVDIATGIGKYTWGDTDMVVAEDKPFSTFDIILWASNGTTRKLATQPARYLVYKSVFVPTFP